jgi:peptide/nickel transport system ATP-binding protein/oligopeptide transport system ATP-binding protein
VGESGSGKSTLGRCVLRLTDIDSGSVSIKNQDVTELKSKELQNWRSKNQIVFQDSYESMNPKYRIEWILSEPLKLHTKMSKTEISARVSELLQMVQLPTSFASRYTNELSGGQLQRVNIARALATNPEFLVLDEPTSSLDHSVQANILALLKDLQAKLDLTYLLISHDLEMIANYCDSVSVMYLGKVLESGKIKDVFENPQHPYTKALLSCTLSANPLEKKTQINLQGLPFSPLDLPVGCRFSSRCSQVLPKCLEAQPEMIYEGTHGTACINI